MTCVFLQMENTAPDMSTLTCDDLRQDSGTGAAGNRREKLGAHLQILIEKIQAGRNHSKKLIPVENSLRSETCPLCSHLASSERRLERHTRLRHCTSATLLEVSQVVVCPVRSCRFSCPDLAALTEHVRADHAQGGFKIRSIYHDIDGGFEEEDQDPAEKKGRERGRREEGEAVVPCTVEGCMFTTSTKKRLRLHIYKRHSKPDGKTYYCQENGCNFTTPNSTNLKIHYAKKHKITKQLEPDKSRMKSVRNKETKTETSEATKTEPTNTEPSTVEATKAEATKTESPVEGVRTTRQGRQMAKKRRYDEENWTAEPPPEKRIRSENSLSSTASGPVRSKVTRSRSKGPAEVKSAAVAEEDPLGSPRKQAQVKLKPHVISFSPVQKALITMTKIHSTMHDQISKIDCIMQNLIVEHANRCSSCKNSVEFCLSQNQFAPVAKSRESELEAKIRDLEAQVSSLASINRKLASLRTGNIPLRTLLEGVHKPNLQKEVAPVN